MDHSLSVVGICPSSSLRRINELYQKPINEDSLFSVLRKDP